MSCLFISKKLLGLSSFLEHAWFQILVFLIRKPPTNKCQVERIDRLKDVFAL